MLINIIIINFSHPIYTRKIKISYNKDELL